jgi:hypothetical protein
VNAVVAFKPDTQVVASLAKRYEMDPEAFEQVVFHTCMPKPKQGDPPVTREEFAAFLLVAKEYNLNPITRQIYCFKKKGGGLQPVVSVDGWAHLVINHAQCNGFTFEDALDKNNKLMSTTCTMYRKDWSQPVKVTEYLSECLMPNSEVWTKYPARMLRHKALIQAARYAFGYSEIVDPDEAIRIAESPQAAAGSLEPPPAPTQPEIVEAAYTAVPDEKKPIADPGPVSPSGPDGAATVPPPSSGPEVLESGGSPSGPTPPDPVEFAQHVIGLIEATQNMKDLDEVMDAEEAALTSLPRYERDAIEAAYDKAKARHGSHIYPSDPFEKPEFLSKEHFFGWVDRAVGIIKAGNIDLDQYRKFTVSWKASREWRDATLNDEEFNEVKGLVSKIMKAAWEKVKPAESDVAPPAPTGAPTPNVAPSSIKTWDDYVAHAEWVLRNAESQGKAQEWWNSTVELRQKVMPSFKVMNELKANFYEQKGMLPA